MSHAWRGLGLLMLVLGGSAAAQEPVLKPLTDRVEAAAHALSAARAVERQEAEEAGRAEGELQGNKNAARNFELARKAGEANERLEDAAEATQRARQRLVREVQELRRAEVRVAECRSRDPQCAAAPIVKASELRVAAAVAPLAVSAVAAAASAPKEYVAAAATAQKSVGGAKTQVTAAFAAGDAAGSTALEQATGAEARFDNVEHAREARSAAMDAYRASRGLQGIANKAVGAALNLANKQCLDPKDPVCSRSELESLQKSIAELSTQTQAVKAAHDRAILASRHIKASDYGDRIKEAIAFLSFVDRHPDAKGLFGTEGYRLSANKDGTDATIKIDLDSLKSNLFQDTALTLTAKDKAKGATKVLSAEGLAADSTLRFSASVWGLQSVGRFMLTGFDASIGQSKHSWVEAADLSKALGRSTRPWSLGAHVAIAGDTKNAGNEMHLLRLGFKSAHADAPAATVCPLAPQPGESLLRCASASVGAPKPETARSFSYEYRYRAAKLGFAPSFAYEDKSGLKELKFPIYLMFNAADPRAFTGGITIERKSRTRDPTSKSEVTFGAFVGAPLSVFSIAD